MKQRIFRLIAECVYRLHHLFLGAPRTEFVRTLWEIERDKGSEAKVWDRILLHAFRRECAHFAIEDDIWNTRETFDPFTNGLLISSYFDEFKQLISHENYVPGGMINTELLLLYCMIRHVQPEIFLESGTMHAYSSRVIAQALLKNENPGTLICLSLFSDDQYEIANERLRKFNNVEIRRGRSEELIDRIISENSSKPCGMLIDGPKAKSSAWDILTEKVADNLSGLAFLCFDSTQEHVPFFPYGERYFIPKRSINIERAKVCRLFTSKFKTKGFELCFQSNYFSRVYFALNQTQYATRNSEWGRSHPWAPYSFDRHEEHVAHTYKMGVIYNPMHFKNTLILPETT